MFTAGNCDHFSRSGITCLLIVHAGEWSWVPSVRSPGT